MLKVRPSSQSSGSMSLDGGGYIYIYVLWRREPDTVRRWPGASAGKSAEFGTKEGGKWTSACGIADI
jgi:hypothetical protein